MALNNEMTLLERFNVPRDIKSYTQILAVDLGHGETSAAVIDLNWDNSDASAENRRDLKMNYNGEDKIISAYSLEDGNEIIGFPAIAAKANPDSKGKLYLNFKRPPQIMDENERLVMRKYFRCIIETICKYNANVDLENCIVIVGCPSNKADWSNESSSKLYADILSGSYWANKQHVPKGVFVGENKIILPVVIMPESRAALIKTYHEQKKKNKIDPSEGIIVFDFGSSTADATYINSGGMDDFSWPLGASYIEEEFIKYYFEKWGENFNNFVCTDEYTPIKYNVRGIKEQFYTGYRNNRDFNTNAVPFRINKKRQYLDVDSDVEEQVTGKRKIELNTGDYKILKGSWRALCRDFFLEAASRFEAKGVKNIILTGGASRMHFIYECCTEVFQGCNIIEDPEPSTCVSRGLAMAGFIDVRSSGLIDQACSRAKKYLSEKLSPEDIKDLFGVEGSKGFDEYNNISIVIGNALKEDICDSVVFKELEKWRDSTISVRELIDNVHRETKAYLGREVCRSKIRDTLSDRLREAVMKNIKSITNYTFKGWYGTNIREGDSFDVPTSVIDDVADRLSQITINPRFDSIIKRMFNYFNLPFVSETKIHDRDARNRMYSRAKADRDFIICGTNSSLLFDETFGIYETIKFAVLKGEVKTKVVDTIYEAIEPIMRTCVNKLALYFC